MIDEQDLVKANATLIVRLLVLLGVSNIVLGNIKAITVAMLATEIFVLPFSASLIASVNGHISTAKHVMVSGIVIIAGGLLFLIVASGA
jgi:hypothetical protein